MMDQEIEKFDDRKNIWDEDYISIYPGLLERIKASIADVVVILIMMYAVSELFGMMRSVTIEMRVFAFLFIFLLYEPLLVSLTGGTLGHHLVKVKVRQLEFPDQKVTFSRALWRYIIKFFLGWISLVTVVSNDNKQALHDLAVGSVVTYK